MKKKDRGLVSLALALASWLYRYFNPSTKSENAAYVLALVLPCRWWSLRTARCLSIPPLGAKQSLLEHRQTEILSILRTCASSSTSSIHRWSLSSAQYQNPPVALPPCFCQLRPPIRFPARRRVSHIAGSQEEFRMLRECAVHGPRYLHTRPLSRH